MKFHDERLAAVGHVDNTASQESLTPTPITHLVNENYRGSVF